ncbi:sarcocystatin-A-like [Lucilia sericata]|uniref:sarcocystatin-A-like n=1 Tax=Lucilia sericata TaxID=13632 RepID=UPI0018A83B7B|nr:sarcocystatin-A-like [Lucilia sericata]
MNKFLICLYFALVVAISSSTARPVDEQVAFKVRGGVRKVDVTASNDAEKALLLSLSKLAAGDGPYLRLEKIHSATTQIVSGSKYQINADFIDNDEKLKNCDVTIWAQPWQEKGIQVTFECKGEEKIVIKHDP